jgi:hypothetical protein
MIDGAVASGTLVLYNRPGNLVPQDAAATGVLQHGMWFLQRSQLSAPVEASACFA